MANNLSDSFQDSVSCPKTCSKDNVSNMCLKCQSIHYNKIVTKFLYEDYSQLVGLNDITDSLLENIVSRHILSVSRHGLLFGQIDRGSGPLPKCECCVCR